MKTRRIRAFEVKLILVNVLHKIGFMTEEPEFLIQVPVGYFLKQYSCPFPLSFIHIVYGILFQKTAHNDTK
jgi:hypothetical protein